MLKKKNRVNKHLFTDVIKGGVACYNQNLSLRAIKIQNSKPRFSVYVPKKELKSAVKRNLLRRRAQSVLQRVLPKINHGFSVVIFLKKGAINIPFLELEDEIIFLLKKSKII